MPDVSVALRSVHFEQDEDQRQATVHFDIRSRLGLLEVKVKVANAADANAAVEQARADLHEFAQDLQRETAEPLFAAAPPR